MKAALKIGHMLARCLAKSFPLYSVFWQPHKGISRIFCSGLWGRPWASAPPKNWK